MPTHDLIVIGGGLVGGGTAWGEARQGASVALLDEGDIAFRAARGTTRRRAKAPATRPTPIGPAARPSYDPPSPRA
jgi:glycine/D-amino acid oxidase-like deaminating enzyme